jgi:hypothetical protein
VWRLLKPGDDCGVLPVLGYINGQFKLVFKQKVKVKFTLEEDMKTQRVSRDVTVFIL